MLDISRGLSFLHSLEIVHGDLKGVRLGPFPYHTSINNAHYFPFQPNILVDGSGRACLSDFGLATAILNCTENSVPGFRGAFEWMAPELFTGTDGNFGLPTCKSDIFALGMVTFEVRGIRRGRPSHCAEIPYYTFLQVFTGQLPFSGISISNSSQVALSIINGKRPPRPREGKELGLSDGLWEFIQLLLAHEAEERPSVSTFADFLEKTIRDFAVLTELTELDANSEEDIQKLRRVFGYGDDTFLGMRESETLVVVEVFDRVSLLVHCLSKPLQCPGFRLSTPPRSVPDVLTCFRKFPPDVAFCRRVTGFPVLASLNTMELSPPQERHSSLAGGWLMESLWLSR